MTKNNKETRWEEGMPKIKDLSNQIMKAFEVMDVSPWNGLNVFEDGDYDVMVESIEDAMRQYAHFIIYSKTEEIVGRMEEELKLVHISGPELGNYVPYVDRNTAITIIKDVMNK